jgi:hypothetical protein
MESTGLPNKIQVSQKTADLIIEQGKGHWLKARQDLVHAKGKGDLQTYWLRPTRRGPRSQISSTADLETESSTGSLRGDSSVASCIGDFCFENEQKLQRLVDWNVVIFENLLSEVIDSRNSKKTKRDQQIKETVVKDGTSIRSEAMASNLHMPGYEATSSGDGKSTGLDPEVVSQLRFFIAGVGKLYHSNNAFHNFEHASHVIMSTAKLLQRIATHDVKKKDVKTKKEYHDYTYGILNPLTKFSIAFAALIHDLDHEGVPNFVLIKEENPIAVMYDGKSPMEQHSLCLAFELLMEPAYKALREAIYSTQEEYDHFRQVSINCVIATGK